MKLVLLVCAFLLTGCLSQTNYSNYDLIELRIQNDSWSTSRARIYCDDGTHLATVYDLRFTEVTSKRVRLPPNCQALVVEVIGHGQSRLSTPRSVVPQEVVCVRVNSIMDAIWGVGCQR